jgi:hypothetical protein
MNMYKIKITNHHTCEILEATVETEAEASRIANVALFASNDDARIEIHVYRENWEEIDW